MIPEIKRISELQLSYSSNNTPEMQERGRIIRQDLPDFLNKHLATFKQNIGRFADDLHIEGSDGKGRKTQARGFDCFQKASQILRQKDFTWLSTSP